MILPHVFALVLLAAFPVWDMWEARQLRQASHPTVKVESYLRIIIGLWVFSILLVFVHPIAYYLPAPAGTIDFLGRMPGGGTSSVIAVALLIGIAAPIVLAVLHRPTRIRTLAAYDQADYLLPRTQTEFILFAAVSISAGICEEFIYRGFLIRYFQETTWGFPLWAAIVASSAIFGLAHAGQGLKGILATFAAGLFLGALFIVTGSLVIPIIVHTCIDLRALVFAHMRTRERSVVPA